MREGLSVIKSLLSLNIRIVHYYRYVKELHPSSDRASLRGASLSDPVDAPRKHRTGKRSADIIPMLVNIYGSKELFINEYRSLLSNQLLAHCSYDMENEIRHMELLKVRFV